ncbi:hypothetical protein NARC_240008 [Candidatus Nitrosocosmicus arcticus]|uniref:Uncharacterized protein n=2 Tax=Candidatus Nitrosocosmicus arcticus TaxID=2035267 RepID=A0A557SQX4_9ARCH|nr:hypothetical protein NARC_240008 [Candidatus Nitrosocosmicus arcticus]
MIISFSPNFQIYGVNILNYIFAQENLTSGLQQFEFNEDLQTALPHDNELDNNENTPEQGFNEESPIMLSEEPSLEEQSSPVESTSNENLTVIVGPSEGRINGEMELTDLKTIPQEVRVGDEFKIQSTIKNGLNEPITSQQNMS